MTVQQIHDQTIRSLPAADRLRLAKLILSDIPPQCVVDYREEWTDKDHGDFGKATWSHIEGELEDADEV